ncbi:DUF4125 family protein [Demequina sediminicola]|uniref:DUF4125 family protein n=1 Tax=Demequina sediminicola TaxID=1095026 RepID=UPI000784FD92|nr:DUF4125 family protein [Demequina sediminicola]
MVAKLDAAEAIVKHEFTQFDQVNSEGGRAYCQDDWPTFHSQRLGQFLTWPAELLHSYAADLDAADDSGRNLLTEKYARMMASTEPERYASEIEPHLPTLSEERIAAQERIIATQVQWAQDFHHEYPRLGANMRLLHTADDTLDDTSFETYLRGELGTYSSATLELYAAMIDDCLARGSNLTAQTVSITVGLAGYQSLDDAESDQSN